MGLFRFDPGFAAFFSIPVPVSYVLNGLIERNVIGNADVAFYIYLVQAWLYTVVNNGNAASNKLYNKLIGTSIDVCSSAPLLGIPSVDDQLEFFECNDDWIAKWIEELPPV